MGIEYGLNGDPISYSQTGKNLLDYFSEGDYETVFTVDPLFRLILIAIEFFTPLSVDEPITYVLVGLISILVSFFLFNGWGKGITSACIFITTIIGFIVTFNLTRTAVSICIFSITYSLIFNRLKDFQRILLSMICASLVHLSWLPLIAISSILFMLRMKGNLFINFFFLGMSFLFILIAVNIELIYFYLDRELVRNEQESDYALLTPILMFIFISTINFYKERISRNLLYLLNVIFLLCLIAVMSGFPLIFERLAVPFLFFTSILISRFLQHRYLLIIIVINATFLFFRVG